MEVVATAKHIGISARKLRSVIDTVRGKSVDEALGILRFTPTPAARVVAKVVKSAVANAENNFELSPSDLNIVKIYASEGHTLRRFRARARGRASPLLKRSSHITVVVEEQEQ